MTSETRSAPRFARPARHPLHWLTCVCLLLCLTACAAPALIPRQPIERPPLASDCWPGPDYPAREIALGELLEIVQAREAAGAECRTLVRAWSDAWPKAAP